MRIAFHSAFLSKYPIGEVIDRVAAVGYDGIELNAETLPGAEPPGGPNTAGAERRSIRRQCTDAGIGISSICAHCNLVESDGEAWWRAIEWTKGCIDLAVE